MTYVPLDLASAQRLDAMDNTTHTRAILLIILLNAMFVIAALSLHLALFPNLHTPTVFVVTVVVLLLLCLLSASSLCRTVASLGAPHTQPSEPALESLARTILHEHAFDAQPGTILSVDIGADQSSAPPRAYLRVRHHNRLDLFLHPDTHHHGPTPKLDPVQHAALMGTLMRAQGSWSALFAFTHSLQVPFTPLTNHERLRMAQALHQRKLALAD